jgi:hypothetical protein
MKRFFIQTRHRVAIVTLLLFPVLSPPACGSNANKVTIEKPPGGGPNGKMDDKVRDSGVLPTLSDDDLRFLAMEELIRIYRSSKTLLTGREMPEQKQGCITYRRVTTGNQFLRANYKDCTWNRELNGQAMKWFMGQKTDGTEVFSASEKDLNAAMKSDITATYQADAAAPPVGRRPHHNSYHRWVKIFRTEASEQDKFPFNAFSGIGLFQQTKIDYFQSSIKGHWNVRNSKLENGQIFLEFEFRPATKNAKKADLIRLSFSPSGPITFEGTVCERPKGTFIWIKYVGDLQVANGTLDVDKDGLLTHTSTPGALLRWPKSCLEFFADPQ